MSNSVETFTDLVIIHVAGDEIFPQDRNNYFHLTIINGEFFLFKDRHDWR